MDWVAVVDDDVTYLKMAGMILSKHNMRVTGLKSGAALIEFLKTNHPDLILLDIKMPMLDGLETLRKLREQGPDRCDIPVVFLTADEHEDSEASALQAGAVDFIRKPFEPAVLVKRVGRIIETQKEMQQYEHDARFDSLTGCLNKHSTEMKMEELCREETGLVCVLDLDSFKLVNDLCGHDAGDNVLRVFAQKLRKSLRSEDVCGRIGGDEFVVFAKNMKSPEELGSLYRRINAEFTGEFGALLGNRKEIPLGLSLGAAAVPLHGRDYSQLFRIADQALASVKRDGKHSWKLAGKLEAENREKAAGMNLETLTAILEERNNSYNAMWMGRDAFISIYRYMVRYMARYHGMAYRVLFTIKTAIKDEEERKKILSQFRQQAQFSMRSSDVMMEIGSDRLFLLLPETHEYDIGVVISRLINQWEQTEYADRTQIIYEAGQVRLNGDDHSEKADVSRNRIAVVDDDEVVLAMAKSVLEKEDFQVTALQSGAALLNHMRNDRPDLIVLDVRMPVMDGIETMHRLKTMMKPGKEIPVIFLTADEKLETEIMALKLGAIDVIRKPVVADILVLRVRHLLELVRLQKNLSAEVDRKTKEYEKLTFQVMLSIADAIDAKDASTNGHSDRVAKYAKEVARRFGYEKEQLDSIYMMGLLHDVGKIGIADAIINKPGKLTEAEYDVIKTHPVIGAKILRNIREKPELAVGARWHHERFDGSGYPDGLAGEEIPEAARIIAVADAYDAMTSRRSYRGILSQETVKNEIIQGKGSQFDPVFADIMLEIIGEDPEYQLKEC